MITTEPEECAAQVTSLIKKYGITSITMGIIIFCHKRLHSTDDFSPTPYPKTMQGYIDAFIWVLDMIPSIQQLDTNDTTGPDLPQQNPASPDGD